MEQVTEPKPTKSKQVTGSSASLRVKRDTKRRVISELAKMNKKEFGRRIKADELVALALSLVESRHVAELQERSLSNSDRLDRHYQQYVKTNGPLSKDDFFGKLLSGEVTVAVLRSTSKAASESA